MKYRNEKVVKYNVTSNILGPISCFISEYVRNRKVTEKLSGAKGQKDLVADSMLNCLKVCSLTVLLERHIEVLDVRSRKLNVNRVAACRYSDLKVPDCPDVYVVNKTIDYVANVGKNRRIVFHVVRLLTFPYT